MFDQVDLDGDHQISYRELVTTLTHEHIRSADERLYVTFCDLDVDDDGYICPEELLHVMKKHNVSTGGQTAESIISSADLNNDGHIDFREFLNAIHPQVYSHTRKQFVKGKSKETPKEEKKMKVVE